MRYSRVLAGFALAGFVLYGLYQSALAGPFIYDDNVTIVNNVKIQSDSIPVVLFEDPFRALPNLTFAAQYHLHFNPALAKPEARPFHRVNLFLHWLCGLALYSVLSRLRPQARAWAFWSSILFLGHPLLTETVNFITARFSLMATLGYLLAVCCYLDAETRPRRIILFWVCFLAALASKEIAATVPATLFILNRWRKKPQRHLLPIALAAAVYFGLRLFWTIILVAEPGPTLNPFLYFLNQNRVLWLYLGKFLWPLHLNFDYQLNYPIAALLPFLFLNLAALAFLILKFRRGAGWAAGALIAVILFLPTSSVIPLADLAKEYHAYLPAAAVLPLLAAGFFTGPRARARLRPAFALIMICMIALTGSRNFIWQSEERLWRDTVAESPEKPRAVYDYAQTLRRQLKLEPALFYYRRALVLDPTDLQTRQNIDLVEQALQSPDLPRWKAELRRRQEPE
jgi:protein O-mannosyl-transferase